MPISRGPLVVEGVVGAALGPLDDTPVEGVVDMLGLVGLAAVGWGTSIPFRPA